MHSFDDWELRQVRAAKHGDNRARLCFEVWDFLGRWLGCNVVHWQLSLLGAAARRVPLATALASTSPAAAHFQDDDKGKRPVSEAAESESEDEELAREGAAGAGEGVEAGEEAAPPPSPRESEPGDMTCAVCLNSIPLENLAMVKVRAGKQPRVPWRGGAQVTQHHPVCSLRGVVD